MTWNKEPKRRPPHAAFPTLAPRPLFTQTKPPVPVVIKKRPPRGTPKKPKLPLNPGRA